MEKLATQLKHKHKCWGHGCEGGYHSLLMCLAKWTGMITTDLPYLSETMKIAMVSTRPALYFYLIIEILISAHDVRLHLCIIIDDNRDVCALRAAWSA